MSDVTLIITRGLPASGKSTKALAWVAEDPTNRARVNRDLYRVMLHGGRIGTYEQEVMVTHVQHAAITALLKKGISVVEDGTNLVQRHARELRKLATFTGAEFEVWDMTDVDPWVCVLRDAQREAMVGQKVIMDMYNRFVKGKSYPLPYPEEPTVDVDRPMPYVPDTSLPKAILVDLDGTVCLNLAGRDIYDYARVCEDSPHEPVVTTAKLYRDAGYKLIFLSGRTDDCFEQTKQWLDTHIGGEYDGPFMRPTGDHRKDVIVKGELFDKHVRNNYNVEIALDDRSQVVDGWRALGLTCYQVADGKF